MVCYYNLYHSEGTILWVSQKVNSKDGIDLPCCLSCGKAGGRQILGCQGINVSDYNFNLDALALKPADFCNLGVHNVRMRLGAG